MSKSLYIHIPFCRKKCPYCDFYSVNYKEPMAASYLKVLSRQIKALEGNFSTIYIGGGTPTVLSKDLLKQLLKSLKAVSSGVREFSIEVNPESLTEDKAKLLLDQGINRVSIGIQSLADIGLTNLGRIHTSKQAQEAIALIRKEGCSDISVDLMFGVWAQTLEGWRQELEKVVTLPITHLSCYGLTYEKKTPFYNKLSRKEIVPLEERIVAVMYKMARDYLPKKGFCQYEVSNFAKVGFCCKHNLNYWQGNSYIGLGPSAVSFLDGTRQRNTRSIADYIKKVDKGVSPAVFKEKLSAKRSARELAAIKIRTKEGINYGWFRLKTGFNFEQLQAKVLVKLRKDGLINYQHKKGRVVAVYLSKRGFLFSDTVSSTFL